MLNSNVQTWLNALRSGDYQQTRHTLHNASGYCCLGVACNIYQTTEQPWESHTDDNHYVTYTMAKESERLPQFIQNKLNLNTSTGEFKLTPQYMNSLPLYLLEVLEHLPYMWPYEIEDTYEVSLAILNDYGLSFDIIADIIESAPPGLFKEST